MNAESDIAISVLNGENPLISFSQTYGVKAELRRMGAFNCEPLRKSWPATKYMQYRVDHGNGYRTQNTWHVGQVNPSVEDIKR